MARKLPDEFNDLSFLSPDVRNVLHGLRTDSVLRTFGVYRALTQRDRLSQFLLQSRLEFRKFIEDEYGNPSDPLTEARLENFWSTLMAVEGSPRGIHVPPSLLVVAGVLAAATLSTGVWHLISKRSQRPEELSIPVHALEPTAAPVIPKKNLDLETLGSRLNDLNAQYSNLVSRLAEIPQARETLSEQESNEAATSEIGALQREWDARFGNFIEKLKELHEDISANPEDSFPKSLSAFANGPFTLESRGQSLQLSFQFLNHLTATTSTPDVNLEDSESDPTPP